MDALENMDWSDYGARILFLITDAGALGGDRCLLPRPAWMQRRFWKPHHDAGRALCCRLLAPIGRQSHQAGQGISIGNYPRIPTPISAICMYPFRQAISTASARHESTSRSVYTQLVRMSPPASR